MCRSNGQHHVGFGSGREQNQTDAFPLLSVGVVFTFGGGEGQEYFSVLWMMYRLLETSRIRLMHVPVQPLLEVFHFLPF